MTPADMHRMFHLREDEHLVWKPRLERSKGDVIFNTNFAGRVAGAKKGKPPYLVTKITVDGEAYFVRIHRVVIAMIEGCWPPKRLSVDHIDGNPCNNRYSNLRVCDQSDNMKNRKIGSNSVSGFKGVGYHKPIKAWVARIAVNGTRKYLGSFTSAYDAAIAYDHAAIRYHGEFARTNASMGLFR